MFSEAEADGKKIKGKGPKVEYLVKAIRCVGIAKGNIIDVNPKKIVAGKKLWNYDNLEPTEKKGAI